MTSISSCNRPVRSAARKRSSATACCSDRLTRTRGPPRWPRSTGPNWWRRCSRASRSAFASTVWLNGAPAGRIEIDGEPAAVSLVVEDGRVTRVYLVRNPRKLTRLDEPADLAR